MGRFLRKDPGRSPRGRQKTEYATLGVHAKHESDTEADYRERIPIDLRNVDHGFPTCKLGHIRPNKH